MEKIYGSPVRQDGLYKIGRNKYELVYGFGKDSEEAETGWNWRQRFAYLPSKEEVRSTIIATINAETDRRILEGFTWRGIAVWLSQENQFNYKAAYDLAVQTQGQTLPVTFKLGTDDAPVYHTFKALDELADFYTSAIGYIADMLNEGWKEKDALDDAMFTSDGTT